jgi:hypothetical protein
LEDQGFVLEILRIRHRGLLEQLKKPGNSWKNTPSFYYVTNIDGLEYISKNVAQHGHVTEVLFNTWDTINQENKVMKDAQEEQETSTVTFTLKEQVKSGLLGRKTKDVDRDTFTVDYDYRTGRWSGDDTFKDYDGYGHYLGETFEIWFNIYQIDSDGDFIPQNLTLMVMAYQHFGSGNGVMIHLFGMIIKDLILILMVLRTSRSIRWLIGSLIHIFRIFITK